jgi:hypothetical protein
VLSANAYNAASEGCLTACDFSPNGAFLCY